MIGHEEDGSEVQFKVADKRKFNPDGSLREGVQIEAAPPPPEPTPAPAETSAEAELPEVDADAELADLEAVEDEGLDDIPGAADPASFVNFLSTLATNAAAALGAIPHPATGQRSLDLESAKYWLDVLGMLREKTKGNLHSKESRLLEGLLGDMRMQYVQIMRASEEQLKAQAAKKFSSSDILGKR